MATRLAEHRWAVLTETIPTTWKSALLVMHVSAMGSCVDTSTNSHCSLRILVVGVEANPTGDPTFYIQDPQASWPIGVDR